MKKYNENEFMAGFTSAMIKEFLPINAKLTLNQGAIDATIDIAAAIYSWQNNSDEPDNIDFSWFYLGSKIYEQHKYSKDGLLQGTDFEDLEDLHILICDFWAGLLPVVENNVINIVAM